MYPDSIYLGLKLPIQGHLEGLSIYYQGTMDPYIP